MRGPWLAGVGYKWFPRQWAFTETPTNGTNQSKQAVGLSIRAAARAKEINQHFQTGDIVRAMRALWFAVDCRFPK